MANKESLKILMETNEKTFDTLHKSNNFLDEKAYNLLKIVGLTLTIWFFSINYLISNPVNLNNPTNIYLIQLIPTTAIGIKTIIIILSIFSVVFYISSIFSLISIFKGREFNRIALNEKNIQKYGKQSAANVFEMIATIFSRNFQELQQINTRKSILIDKAIHRIEFGIFFTILSIFVILLVI